MHFYHMARARECEISYLMVLNPEEALARYLCRKVILPLVRS